MATQNTLDKQRVTTVPCNVTLPPDRSSLGKGYIKQKPTFKVGRVIWSGGTKRGSFPKPE